MNARNQGFTLPELLVVTLIGAVVLTAVYQTLTIQERSNRQQIAVVTTQQNTRVAIALIAGDLREVSAKDGDVLDATSTNIRYRALRKTGIVCHRDYSGGNNWMHVVSLGQDFDNQDSLLIFQEGTSKTAALDDGWITARVNNVSGGTLCPGYTAAGAVNKQQLQFPGNNIGTTDTGSLVRSFVHVGYRAVNIGGKRTLFRIETKSNSSGTFTTDSVAVVEDLAETDGLRLQYYDSAGTQITPSTAALRAKIMRIEIKARGSVIGGQSGSRRVYSDSLIGQVYLRGNNRTT